VAVLVLQIIPLPFALFSRLSPGADAVLRATDLQYVLNPPTSHPLAIQPGSAVTVMSVFAGFSLLLVGLTAILPRLRIDRLIVQIAVFGVALAAVAVALKAADVRDLNESGVQLVYGFWRPPQAGDVFGPFVNRNHFAGWMVMALPLALGYSCWVLETSGPSQRDDWRGWLRWAMRPSASRFMTAAVAVLAMGAALVISGSRSGMASFALTVGVMAYFVATRLARRRLRWMAVWYLGVLVSGAVIWAGVGAAADRFSLAGQDIVSRVNAWRDSMRIAADFPIFGTGVGSYGRAMLVYQTHDRDMFYFSAHNEYVQILAEGGLLLVAAFIVCVVGLVRAIRTRLLRGEDNALLYWVRAGAIAGIIGMAAQSMIEFSLHLSGNAVLFVVLLAIAIHRPRPAMAPRRG
jgi:putative inorganic carbon (HCO3(-)) transporter